MRSVYAHPDLVCSLQDDVILEESRTEARGLFLLLDSGEGCWPYRICCSPTATRFRSETIESRPIF